MTKADLVTLPIGIFRCLTSLSRGAWFSRGCAFDYRGRRKRHAFTFIPATHGLTNGWEGVMQVVSVAKVRVSRSPESLLPPKLLLAQQSSDRPGDLHDLLEAACRTPTEPSIMAMSDLTESGFGLDATLHHDWLEPFHSRPELGTYPPPLHPLLHPTIGCCPCCASDPSEKEKDED